VYLIAQLLTLPQLIVGLLTRACIQCANISDWHELAPAVATAARN